MRLEQSLVLNRYCHHMLGAQTLAHLKQTLYRAQEGPRGEGSSWFFHALAALEGRRLSEEALRVYDERIMSYESRLAHARGRFAFKYFQYLCLLYTEIFLDRLTDDPARFVADLNQFLTALRGAEPSLREFPGFAEEDLRRLAFFMATGAGKTLLLHVNLWQALHYLEHGRHPEALVRRPDRRREFDSILLVTPNEGLSQQHLLEFGRSRIDAVGLVDDQPGRTLFGPVVKLIEIHKLAEEPSREGTSIPLEELGGANLVFVDEGHKGAGSEAQTWKNRQKSLSASGFLVEYSATFAQAIAAAGRSVQRALINEYGKVILFDYSYRHFYDDGYGKDFRVLNLKRAREDQAHDLLLGGLLAFYQQLQLYREQQNNYREYNLERPLWVFLGSSVNAVYSREGRMRSDIAAVVAFLRRFLEEDAWAVRQISRLLVGESGFVDAETNTDLFAPHLKRLRASDPKALYREVAREVFHGRGGLQVLELKGADGELGLRVSTGEGTERPYFGLINIGDVGTFKRHLDEHLGIEVGEDRFTSSLFAEVNESASRINILIGSKKFIEGWSSWRVSAMGLLNMGKGQGPQVIQLFGRGVRLKGKRWTLKRSAMLPEDPPHPDGVGQLETLLIFGWNADYVQAFREMLESEDVGRELQIPLQTLFDPVPELLVPQPRQGYRTESETWILVAESPNVSLDVTPRLAIVAGGEVGAARATDRREVSLGAWVEEGLLDLDAL
jgi:hypothetical protein